MADLIRRFAAACLLLCCSLMVAAAPAPVRLPEGVRPLAYQLALTVDPARPTHSGEVEITIELKQPQRSIVMHARELQVRSAWVELGARRHAARVQAIGGDRIELRFAQAVPAGRALLGLAFSGRLQDKEFNGLFRRLDGGDWYAYTQFQPIGARLAFPLFDEPGWKLPWSLTLTVPQALQAFANMPVQREEAAAPGFKRIVFEPTPPLPSYLLAFGVGPFDVLDAPPAGPVPVRFITPRGRAAEAAFAAGITARIVERLEDYFGQPYPFTKLDNLGLSVPGSFGAMEHPGLVTFALPLLLNAPSPGRAPDAAFQRNYIGFAAHEIAHQWFGNLVTMAWWDDLWLNESFASWLGERITAELIPDEGGEHLQAARARAMRSDRLPSTRRVQQPVGSDDDFAHLWDAITYEKGQVVLAMFEQWLGPERFRDGVRRYINRHAWGSASADHFFAALGQQDPALPAALRSFIGQPGMARVAVQLQCDGERPRLRLAQSRLQPLGAAEAAGAARWQLPMLIRTPGGLTRHLLQAAEETINLPDAACPAWVQANAGGIGYYRVAQEPAALRRLMALPQLPAAEVLAGLDDAAALSEAGELPLAELLAMAESFARHADRAVVEQAARVLLQAQPVAAALDPVASAARWQRAFGERARALGWLEADADGEDQRQLRALLVPLVADLGADSVLRAAAGLHAQAWLRGQPLPIGRNRSSLLAAAAIDGDAALFDTMLSAARRSSDGSERIELFAALGHFRAPVLAQRARELLLDPALDYQEVGHAVLAAHNETPSLRDGLLPFLSGRHAQLARRMGRDEPAWLPSYLNQSCSTGDAERIERAFARHAPRYAGGSRTLAQTLEAVRLCAAWRAHQAGAPA
ncbi:M1 family metallopeptidase [Aquincola sp. S2]|uniref:Aminopeptidase n=1 Tax=Pseudaquabacterium terrae TaxID=2732868 RepID=A0ABX2EJL2_9BURK|nr:M1 family metallopeptidase [Aquabacterium terrae]NRF68739.1 M1 family metallopeptidase [Aquabacterium terrae]